MRAKIMTDNNTLKATGPAVETLQEKEEQVHSQGAVLDAINRTLREALTCETHEQVAQTCLKVAEQLTGSKFGFIGEINQAGLFDTIAISNPGWDACTMPGSETTRLTTNMIIRGIDRSVLREGKSRIVNDPASHPDRVGTPKGHPPITSFLGVPLKYTQKTIGMIGLANKEGGYDSQDQQAIEALSAAFVEALYHKREEEARRQSDERLSVVHDALNSSVNGVIITSVEGMITYSNPAFLSMFEYESEDDVVGKNAADLFVSDQVRKFADVTVIIEQTKWETEEFDVTHKDGSMFPVEVSSAVVTDKEGNVVGRMAAFVDITDRKKAEAELQKHRDHLEELVKDRTAELETTNDQLQQEVTERKRVEQELQRYADKLEEVNTELSQYAYVVSHDVREPLRAIHNYAEFLHKDLKTTLKGDQKEYLEGLGRAVSEAEELVEDLLELAQIGQQTISIETIKMGVFLQDLIASLKLPADVEVVMARNNWPAIEAEPTLLRQIFQNLINNAIKFNQSPQKYLELGWQPVGDASYEFFVRDNGIGIASRYQEQIFGAFNRLHTKQDYEGTGIGLAIVKKATGRLGGSIRLESELDSGSTFFVTLPKDHKE